MHGNSNFGIMLSPLLFLVYINDIPLSDSKRSSYPSLFADDLAVTYLFKKPGIEIIILTPFNIFDFF